MVLESVRGHCHSVSKTVSDKTVPVQRAKVARNDDEKEAIMDPATILVLVLCAGVLAMLAWFEINSHRNAASKKQSSSPPQSGLANSAKPTTNEIESEIDKTTAA